MDTVTARRSSGLLLTMACAVRLSAMSSVVTASAPASAPAAFAQPGFVPHARLRRGPAGGASQGAACAWARRRTAMWRRQSGILVLSAAESNMADNGDDEQMGADEGMSALNPVEIEYMQGWNDIMYSSLRRRNAVVGELALGKHYLPDPSMSPRDVISKVINALMVNDVPFPDHGCAVAIRFSSGSNPVSEMDAQQLGTFFRSSDLRMIVIEGERFEFLGDLVTESNHGGDFAIQDVLVEGLYESQLRIRWQLKRDTATGSWLTEQVSVIRPGPI